MLRYKQTSFIHHRHRGHVSVHKYMLLMMLDGNTLSTQDNVTPVSSIELPCTKTRAVVHMLTVTHHTVTVTAHTWPWRGMRFDRTRVSTTYQRERLRPIESNAVEHSGRGSISPVRV